MGSIQRAFSQRGLSASDCCVFLGERGLFQYWRNLGHFSRFPQWSDAIPHSKPSTGLPVVTLPGKFMRGRRSYAILRNQVPDTIAVDKRDCASRHGSASILIGGRSS